MNRLTEARGRFVECTLCGGAGLRSVWSFGVKEPDECPDCGGSGLNWQYPRGAIASYYGGPFIGRAALTAQEQSAPVKGGE